MTLPLPRLKQTFGDIDIYLFDQLLKGRITEGMTILDAGCGAGRNVAYLLAQRLEVHGVDRDASAVSAARRLAAELVPSAPADRFLVSPLERLPYADAAFDAVLAVASLHFADDEADFDAMLGELWRVLRTGGMLFARLASDIGIETRVVPLPGGGRRYRLPDGSDRFLVDEAMLLARSRALGGELLEPVKTVNVQGMRAMTTWVVRKS